MLRRPSLLWIFLPLATACQVEPTSIPQEQAPVLVSDGISSAFVDADKDFSSTGGDTRDGADGVLDTTVPEDMFVPDSDGAIVDVPTIDMRMDPTPCSGDADCENALGPGTACFDNVCIESRCADGEDNDRDGLRDCLEPECAEVTQCIGAIPPVNGSEFSHLFVWLYPDGEIPESCPDGKDPIKYVDAVAPPLACQCSCAEDRDQACGMGSLVCYSDNNCMNEVARFDVSGGGTDPDCIDAPGLENLSGETSCMYMGDTKRPAAACKPSFVGETRPSPNAMAGCAAEVQSEPATCVGARCVGVVDAGEAKPRLCTWSEGLGRACPDGWPERFELGENPNDSRQCDCACGAEFECHLGHPHLHGSSNCGFGSEHIKDPFECTTISDGDTTAMSSISVNIEPELKDGALTCGVISSTTGEYRVDRARTYCCRGIDTL